jgi:shikimate kinase
MAIVVLLGYSTSGKSTIGDAVRQACEKDGRAITVRDSDDEIGADHGGHIVDIYLSRDHAVAVKLIEQAGREFLEELQDGGPMLVVTGPNLPLREPEWSEFLARVKPICYYLVITNSRCYSWLADRQGKLGKQHGTKPRFGSWNFGSLCDYDAQTRRYVDVNPEEARGRLKDLMRENVARYERRNG